MYGSVEHLEKNKNGINDVNKYLDSIKTINAFKDNPYHSVYGEITENSVENIVEKFKNYFNNETVFYDLGCGFGKMVIHIGIKYGVKKSCGVELFKGRIDCGKELKETYCNDLDNIQLIEGDFLKIDLSDATVVYMDNTMYESELTLKVLDKIPKNCLFISRKSVNSKNYSDLNKNKITNDDFMTTYNSNTFYFLIKK
jgi:predicted RNA methylase